VKIGEIAMIRPSKDILILLIVSLFSLLTACSATYHLYDKTKLTNDNELAILYYDFDFFDENNNIKSNSLKIIRVDETPGPCHGIGYISNWLCTSRWFGSSWDGSYRIKLLSGEHVIICKFKSDPTSVVQNYKSTTIFYSEFTKTLKFTAKEGHKYIVNAKYFPDKNEANAWIEDTTEELKVRN